MYCHIHHCRCSSNYPTGQDNITEEELIAFTQEMKQELKDYTVDLKEQIFSYTDVDVNPVEIVNTFDSLRWQDTYILRTLTEKIDELDDTTNLSMFNLRSRVTNLEGQSAAIIQDLADRTQRIDELEDNFSSLPFEGSVFAGGLGVWGNQPPTSRPIVEGSITDGTALKSLLTALESYGLITDSTTE